MSPLNNMRNSDFSWGKIQQKTFEGIKNELCANPIVQPYSFKKEATYTSDAYEKAKAKWRLWTSTSLRLIWWPKQKLKPNLEQTDSFRI